MSSATITALSVLENPRSAPGLPKTVYFDAHLYFGEERRIIAALKYFNSKNLTFDEVNVCLIVATIVPFKPEIYDKLLPRLAINEYHLVGDISYIIPLSFDKVPDLCIAPYLHTSGVATNIEDWAFNVDVSQRTQLLANSQLQVSAVLDHKRYAQAQADPKKKPIPKKGSIISMGGPITAVIDRDGQVLEVEQEHTTMEELDGDDDDVDNMYVNPQTPTHGQSSASEPESAHPQPKDFVLKGFRATVETIAFLGYATMPAAKPAVTPNSTDKPLKFDYGSHNRAKTASPSPSPLAKKRKVNPSDSSAAPSN